MANLQLISSIPMERLIMIVQRCAQHDWPEGPHANHIESSHNAQEYKIDDKNHAPWVTATDAAIEDICKIRLVCKVMRAASYQSFGTIIGCCRFRFTESGLGDLKVISKDLVLAPCVKTLTFASTDFTEWKCRVPQSEAHEHITCGDGTLAHREAADTDKFVKEFKALPMSTVERELNDTLRAFDGLENVRIAAPHPDLGDVSIVWIKPDGELYTAMKNDGEALGEQIVWLDDTRIDLNDQKEYITEGFEVANTVLTVLRKAGIHVQDFRVCSTFELSSFQRSLLPGALHTLRLTVRDTDCRTASPLMVALASMTNLENFALVLHRLDPSEPVFEPSSDYPQDLSWERETKAVFRAVENTQKLRCVALEGEWAYTQASLLAFVEQHASSLRCLILYGRILNAYWIPTLHGIADLTNDSLDFLSVKFTRALRI